MRITESELAKLRTNDDDHVQVIDEWGGDPEALSRLIAGDDANGYAGDEDASTDGVTVVTSGDLLEQEEQAAFVRWFRDAYPDLILFAIPNGGHRFAAVAGKLKAEGVLAGVPDLFLALPVHYVTRITPRGLVHPVCPGWHHGLFIEMKRQGRQGEKNGGLSDAQVERITELRREGYAVAVCYGAEDAKDTVIRYLSGDYGEEWKA